MTAPAMFGSTSSSTGAVNPLFPTAGSLRVGDVVTEVGGVDLGGEFSVAFTAVTGAGVTLLLESGDGEQAGMMTVASGAAISLLPPF